ncbi:DNA replication factor GINS [Methanobrevibacter gottschalkii]|uniref:DNA replication factor GINS n=2 Tax=Methanobrevibacter gottschalkii TaxID=190974 RepID=A0A3N5B628_9EURY|nr:MULTISPECIES: hypothetical protein [Methanobrevibacter]MCQ2971606.1 hypothetical protein [archaeon]OEC93940.1 hypothetical protein A9505_01155 [Methanobrevibacter sp. A27]RPF52727.1 DNA replication factor GINS [Methanobrevibacter gottschalkii DSM 11977]SEK25194.1 DNA replication factor GINS [Methanobrevibacter gottschalkii]
MDQFYQELRKIQKKERNNGTLARVDENFYASIHEYLDELRQEAIRDPFSNIHGMLKEAQIIATEICERREHKITDAAVVNIHRSYRLFTGKPKFDLVDTTPLNLTPEEEKFYFSLLDTLKNHRGNISLEKLSDDDEFVKPKETQTNTLVPKHDEIKPKVSNLTHDNESEDEVLNRLDEISRAKPLKKEPLEPKIESKTMSIPKTQAGNIPEKSIEINPNAFDKQDEFYDLESKKLARDTELVTMLVFDEINPIVGVDEKVYGPFRPQDLVTLPLINAKVFFKNRKGRQIKI